MLTVARRSVAAFGGTVALTVVFALGCSDSRDVTPPHRAVKPAAPSADVLDAVHGGGNPHFYLLPPLVANPAYSGTFDAAESPTISVCAWSASGCGAAVAQFSMTSGTGAQLVRVDTTEQLYIVNWDTDECVSGPCTLDPNQVYRLSIAVAGTELGHADVYVVANQQQAKDVITGDYIALVDGRTLPIKFRIEQGAVTVLGTSGGTATDASGAVTLSIPPGALSQPTGITIEPMASYPATAGLVGGAVYDFGPDGTQFAAPATITIAYDPSKVPGGVDESTLGLMTQDNTGAWVAVPGSTVDVGNHTVTGEVTHFSGKGAGQIRKSANTLAAGGDLTCAIGASTTTYCWGTDSANSLGSTTYPATQCQNNGLGGLCSNTPVAVTPPSGIVFTSVTVGGYHACGLTSAGAPYCWGWNDRGQSGGTAAYLQTPTAVSAGSTTYSQISAGHNFTCGVSSAGSVSCWGADEVGQLGNGPQASDSPTPVSIQAPAGVTFTSVSAGRYHACALASSGAVYCWGGNFAGQIGLPTQTAMLPTLMPTPAGVSFGGVAAGRDHTCVVSTTGTIYCTGSNIAGQIGTGVVASDSIYVPTAISAPSGVTFSAVAAGGNSSCGLAAGGALYCWGENAGGGTATNAGTPALVPGGLTFIAVTIASSPDWLPHACGLVKGGTIYCWGDNTYGVLGNGTFVSSTTPVAAGATP